MGQRYFPLVRAGRSRATLTITRLAAGSDSAEAVRDGNERRAQAVKLSRLLALDSAGRGRHYRFLGFKPGRAYPTHAQVVELDPKWVRMICPEWQPEIPITVAIGAVPPPLRRAGAWVSCRSDLGATNPARVNPNAITTPAADFDPVSFVPVIANLAAPEATPAQATNERIVLFVAPPEPDGCVYLTGHPPPLGPGDRAYFAAGGKVQGSCTVRSCRPRPNGVELRFECDWQAHVAFAAPPVFQSGVRSGRHGRQLWTAIDEPP